MSFFLWHEFKKFKLWAHAHKTFDHFGLGLIVYKFHVRSIEARYNMKYLVEQEST